VESSESLVLNRSQLDDLVEAEIRRRQLRGLNPPQLPAPDVSIVEDSSVRKITVKKR
jgi:hypothetical protein